MAFRFLVRSRRGRGLLVGLTLFSFLALALAFKTSSDLRPFPSTLDFSSSDVRKVQVLDRGGRALNITYLNTWNIHDYLPLHEIPRSLQSAFIVAEDKRFFEHGGIDRLARLSATAQNIRALAVVRGASTITEQVVRMIHPRARTFWSRWLEGFEARRLERRFSKAAILEFYLNQVPYAAKRRGVVQAARYYFDRDLDTLSTKEALALAVLVRSPSRLDLFKHNGAIERPLRDLSTRLYEKGIISYNEHQATHGWEFALSRPEMEINASHFVNYIYREGLDSKRQRARLATTLDRALQMRVQDILDSRLSALKKRNVENAAALVVDHLTGEVLAWVNAGVSPLKTNGIDAVTTRRQPGSTLKPLLYTLALEKGWTAATIIEDSQLSSPVGSGLHSYHNYSRRHYGKLRLRDALGNSLNIPAVRAVRFTGVDDFLTRLRSLGLKSLKRGPEHYGEGLALGNGEVTLLELVTAYSTLARGGSFRALSLLMEEGGRRDGEVRVIDREAASLISSILSDPQARTLEFGRGNLLNFPIQTAVKTGTSNDYRDAWAVGFTHRYTVGVWMGNLGNSAMQNISGSTGPALVLRAIFSELGRRAEPRPLYISSKLRKTDICRITGLLSTPECPSAAEWFRTGNLPKKECAVHAGVGEEPRVLTARATKRRIKLLQPSPGMQMALDPRIPDEVEAFALKLSDFATPERVDWMIDSSVVGTTNGKKEFLWHPTRGSHLVSARVWQRGATVATETPKVRFHVK
ncbi:MAG: transglycosylase domain-containing protein [Thermodesulfobacteriota bacterium]